MVAAPDVYWCAHCNLHCGGGGIVAGCCGWIVVSRCTCGCCSAPA